MMFSLTTHPIFGKIQEHPGAAVSAARLWANKGTYMMQKLVAIGLVFALAAASFGAGAEEIFVKPGSAKGFVAVVNRQTKVAEKEFANAVEYVRKDKPFVFKFVKDDAEARDAAVVVRIVDEAGKPPMTVSPEVGRGEMNVAALAEGIPANADAQKTFLHRVRSEFLRTVAYAFGAGGSRFTGNIMTVFSIGELDSCAEFLPVDTLSDIARNAKKLGLRPEYAVSYTVACEEGWAPQPKTDEQRRIWKEVHAMPENPIRIKFDPKTDK